MFLNMKYVVKCPVERQKASYSREANGTEQYKRFYFMIKSQFWHGK